MDNFESNAPAVTRRINEKLRVNGKLFRIYLLDSGGVIEGYYFCLILSSTSMGCG